VCERRSHTKQKGRLHQIIRIKWAFAHKSFHTGTSCFTADFCLAVRFCIVTITSVRSQPCFSEVQKGGNAVPTPLHPRKSSPARSRLHNSESSEGQIDQHKFSAGRKSLFRCTVIWKNFGMTINYTRSRAFAIFSAIEKALAGHFDLFYHNGYRIYTGPRASVDKVNVWNLLHILRGLKPLLKREVNNETSFTSLKSYYGINIVACYMQYVYFFSFRQRYYTK